MWRRDNQKKIGHAFQKAFCIPYQSTTRRKCKKHLGDWETVKKSSEQVTKDRILGAWGRKLRQEKKEKYFEQSKEQEGKQQDWGSKMFCELENINWVRPFWQKLDISQVWKRLVDLKNTCFWIGIGKYLAHVMFHVLSLLPSAKSHQGTSSPQHQDNILHDIFHFL